MTPATLSTPTSPSIEVFPPSSETGSGRRFTTALTVDVVSGNAIPVAWADVHVEYEYSSGDRRAIAARAGGDGRVELLTIHEDPPEFVSLWTGAEAADVYAVTPNMSVVLEV